MNQKQIFLKSEGDKYYARNGDNIRGEYIKKEDLTNMLISLPLPKNNSIKLLEIGCGNGERLRRIRKETNWEVIGVDPSKKCIKLLEEEMIEAYVGTADCLPLDDESVDILVYGFCLYLCDREDLFKIAAEANRVTKKIGWLAIIDFWVKNNKENDYIHCNNVLSYKTRPEEMFTWHPHYTVMDHKIRSIGTNKYTDDPENWVASTLVRKCGDP